MKTTKFEIGDKVRVIASKKQLEKICITVPISSKTIRTVCSVDWYGASTNCELDEMGYLLDDGFWYKESYLKAADR